MLRSQPANPGSVPVADHWKQSYRRVTFWPKTHLTHPWKTHVTMNLPWPVIYELRLLSIICTPAASTEKLSKILAQYFSYNKITLRLQTALSDPWPTDPLLALTERWCYKLKWCRVTGAAVRCGVPRPLSVLFCRACASTTACDCPAAAMNGSIGVPPYIACIACIIASAPSAFPPPPPTPPQSPVCRTSSANIISCKRTTTESFIKTRMRVTAASPNVEVRRTKTRLQTFPVIHRSSTPMVPIDSKAMTFY